MQYERRLGRRYQGVDGHLSTWTHGDTSRDRVTPDDHVVQNLWVLPSHRSTWPDEVNANPIASCPPVSLHLCWMCMMWRIVMSISAVGGGTPRGRPRGKAVERGSNWLSVLWSSLSWAGIHDRDASNTPLHDPPSFLANNTTKPVGARASRIITISKGCVCGVVAMSLRFGIGLCGVASRLVDSRNI
jgi:hypothetical protein